MWPHLHFAIRTVNVLCGHSCGEKYFLLKHPSQILVWLGAVLRKQQRNPQHYWFECKAEDACQFLSNISCVIGKLWKSCECKEKRQIFESSHEFLKMLWFFFILKVRIEPCSQLKMKPWISWGLIFGAGTVPKHPYMMTWIEHSLQLLNSFVWNETFSYALKKKKVTSRAHDSPKAFHRPAFC